MRQIQSPRAFFVGFLLVPVVFWAGCGDDASLTAPDKSADQALELQGAPASGKNLPGYPWYVVGSAKINPGEGQTTIEGSRYTLTFSKGAVQRATTVVIMERDPNKLDVQLFPDGSVFDGPVTMTVDYTGTIYDPGSPTYLWGPVRVGRYESATKTWTVLPGTDDTEAKTYTMNLTGFSRYASGDAIGNAGTQTNKDIPPPAQID